MVAVALDRIVVQNRQIDEGAIVLSLEPMPDQDRAIKNVKLTALRHGVERALDCSLDLAEIMRGLAHAH